MFGIFMRSAISAKVLRVWALMSILILFGLQSAGPIRTPMSTRLGSEARAVLAEPDPATQARVNAAYGKLPLSFEANQGQTDGSVKFLSRGRGYNLFLTPTEAVLALRVTDQMQDHESALAHPQSAVLRMKLIGANPRPQITGLAELPGKVHYFIGNDPKQWRTNLATYAKVKYEQVYPGVDLVYYGNQRQLEYDFVVAAGADPKVIGLSFEGVDKLDMNGQGELVLHLPTSGEPVRLHKPVVYQEVRGVRQEIASGYILRDKYRVGFEVGAYNTAEPLVIDPVLIYSTYLGGSSNDIGNSIAVDAAGNAYVTGETRSANFPTTKEAFQTTFGGGICSGDRCPDAFVTKLDPKGAALIYSTYLGGSSNDIGNSIAVDAAGNAYVTGQTCSENFPTSKGAVQTTLDGDQNAFVTKLNPEGSALVYSTYLGGNNDDSGKGIAVDAAGNAYVTGETRSDDFPTTKEAFQTTFGGGTCARGPCPDAFVTKLDPAGAKLVYSTYLGGKLFDIGNGIAVDAAGNTYVTGYTNSTNFPTTKEAFQTTLAVGGPCRTSPGPCTDAFVTKLDPAGAALIYSTYLGGSSNDIGNSIAVDADGNTYVTGWTRSDDFPVTKEAFQTTFGGGICSGDRCPDAFVTKLDPKGAALIYSTYLGGSRDDRSNGIAVDAEGNTYMTGWTFSDDFPTTKDAFQTTHGGLRDAFVTKLNPKGAALVYSTYLGGSSNDIGNGIAVDADGNAYVTGETRSDDFPVTKEAFQTTFGGGGAAFVAKIGR